VKQSLILLLIMMLPSVVFAQKIETVEGSYTYYAPENVTLEQAKRTALDRAKIQAIAEFFGTLVSQSNTTVISNANGQTDSRFFSLGGSEVKGEWIETIGEPIYNIRYEGNTLVVAVSIKGKARKITNAGIDFTAKILRNGTEEKFESNIFRNGDDMYLYFQSPVDGYLTVYLLDETTQEVFCLLPYKASGDGAYRIEHDKPYILFSAKDEKLTPNIVDEYIMTCSRQTEFNDIYVIFSTNSFTKAISNETTDNLLPRNLSHEAFLKWLTKNKKRDSEMKSVTIGIKITNN